MKGLVTALVCMAASATFSVQAQGFYAGGSVGRSDYKGPDVGGAPTDRHDTGGKVYGGYEFHPNVGVELGYATVGKFTSAAGDFKGQGVFVDAVGKLPITQNLSGLARIGVFDAKAKSTALGTDRSTKYKVGAGVQYDFTPNAGVRGEWERYRFEGFGTNANTDLYSVGLNYRF